MPLLVFWTMEKIIPSETLLHPLPKSKDTNGLCVVSVKESWEGTNAIEIFIFSMQWCCLCHWDCHGKHSDSVSGSSPSHSFEKIHFTNVTLLRETHCTNHLLLLCRSIWVIMPTVFNEWFMKYSQVKYGF